MKDQGERPRPRVEPLEHERPHDDDSEALMRGGVRDDDETDEAADDWESDDQFERDLYGGGRFNR